MVSLERTILRYAKVFSLLSGQFFQHNADLGEVQAWLPFHQDALAAHILCSRSLLWFVHSSICASVWLVNELLITKLG